MKNEKSLFKQIEDTIFFTFTYFHVFLEKNSFLTRSKNIKKEKEKKTLGGRLGQHPRHHATTTATVTTTLNTYCHNHGSGRTTTVLYYE